MKESGFNDEIESNEREYITHTNFYISPNEKKRRQKENLILNVCDQNYENNLPTVIEESSINNSFENEIILKNKKMNKNKNKNSSLINIIGEQNISNYIYPVFSNFKRFRLGNHNKIKMIKSNSQKLLQTDPNNKKYLLEKMNAKKNIEEKFEQFLKKVKEKRSHVPEVISKNINYSIFDPTDLMIRFTKKYGFVNHDEISSTKSGTHNSQIQILSKVIQEPDLYSSKGSLKNIGFIEAYKNKKKELELFHLDQKPQNINHKSEMINEKFRQNEIEKMYKIIYREMGKELKPELVDFLKNNFGRFDNPKLEKEIKLENERILLQEMNIKEHKDDLDIMEDKIKRWNDKISQNISSDTRRKRMIDYGKKIVYMN